MSHPAPSIAGDITYEAGIVGPSDGSFWTVRTASGSCVAGRAASCLVAPRPGDTVSVARTAAGAYVVDVLEQAPSSKPTTVALDGDLEVRLDGRLGLSAKGGIELGSERDVAVVSDRVSVHAGQAEASLGRTTLVGQLLVSQVERVKQVAGRIDQIAERVSQTVDRCYRFVKSRDQLRAESIDHKAEQTLVMHAHNAAVTADRLIKVDGDQIHLG